MVSLSVIFPWITGARKRKKPLLWFIQTTGIKASSIHYLQPQEKSAWIGVFTAWSWSASKDRLLVRHVQKPLVANIHFLSTKWTWKASRSTTFLMKTYFSARPTQKIWKRLLPCKQPVLATPSHSCGRC